MTVKKLWHLWWYLSTEFRSQKMVLKYDVDKWSSIFGVGSKKWWWKLNDYNIIVYNTRYKTILYIFQNYKIEQNDFNLFFSLSIFWIDSDLLDSVRWSENAISWPHFTFEIITSTTDLSLHLQRSFWGTEIWDR